MVILALLVLSDRVLSYAMRHASVYQLHRKTEVYHRRLKSSHENSLPLRVMSDAASVENTEIVVVNTSGSIPDRIRSYSRLMYKFSRPHTIKVRWLLTKRLI